MTSPRVLVVEDDPLVRTAMVRICDWLELEVTAVEDGLRGIASLADRRYDLVLTDLRMPGASGLDVARQALSLSPPTAVIIVSGFASPDEEAQINSVGAGFLRKPFDAAGARKVIRDALGSF